MVQCTDVEGNAFQYTYDSDVRITQINTAQGPWQFVHEDYDYNSADDTYYTHVVHVTDPAGATEMYGYETHSRYVPDHVQSYFHTDQLGNITLSEVNAVIDGKGKIAVAP